MTHPPSFPPSAPLDAPPPPDGEGVAEVTALFGRLAEAFGLSAEALAQALETGALTLTPGADAGGRYARAVLRHQGGGGDGPSPQARAVRVYRDALYHETSEDGTDPTLASGGAR